MIILGIETTCDETGAAVIETDGDPTSPVWLKTGHFRIRSNVIASQEHLHARYGGVVPIIAARAHRENLPGVIERCLDHAKIKRSDLDLIAYAAGPGLPPALLAGRDFVANLAQQTKTPVLPVNHLLGHLATGLIKNIKAWQQFRSVDFPALGLIASGGHTVILLLQSLTVYKKLGETLDDAIGESLDKGARLLDLAYPGGPKLEALAALGQPLFTLPRPLAARRGYQLSFSGLKTAFAELVEEVRSIGQLTAETRAHLAASFQKAVFETLLVKLKRASEAERPRSLIVGGGVLANREFRRLLSRTLELPLFAPHPRLATDNGVQVALAALLRLPHEQPFDLAQGKPQSNPAALDFNPTWSL